MRRRANRLIVVVLAVIGLLTIMQWTARTVLKHVTIASQSLFPAALMIQRAGTAFQSMNREYRDAVALQERASLESADRDAAEVDSRIDIAGKFMGFNSSRHQQIVPLRRRVNDLRSRAKVSYAAAADTSANLPETVQSDLRDIAVEHEAVRTALETLQSGLESDFRAELAVIRWRSRIQGVLGAVLLVSVITALFFSTRVLIKAGARRRGVEVLDEAHRDADVLLNSVPSLLIGLDANGRIQQWNKAATMILGWQEAIVLGKTLDECGVKWLTADLSSRVAAYAQEPAAHSLDGIKLDRNGAVRSLGLKANQLNAEGGAGMLIVGADITERMELEEQLRQAQKLESIGQLAAGIAHEINTPTQYSETMCNS